MRRIALAAVLVSTLACGERSAPPPPAAQPPAAAAPAPAPAAEPAPATPAAPAAEPAPVAAEPPAQRPAPAVKPAPAPAAPAPAAPAPSPEVKAPPAVPATPPAAAPAAPAPEKPAAPAAAEHAKVGPGKCRMCHKVQHASWEASPHAAKGLDCEGCHGNGGDYWTAGVMKDRAKAQAAGLVIPGVDACRKCHAKADAAFLPKAHAHKGG